MDCGSVVVGGTKDFVVGSTIPPNPAYPPSLFVTVYNSELEDRRDYVFPIDSGEFAYMNGIEVTSDTSILCYGYFWNNQEERIQGFIQEINDDFCPTTSSTESPFTSDKNQLVVYPNPTENSISFAADARETDYAIYDHLGNSVLKGRITSNTTNDLNLADLPSGAYVLIMLSHKGIERIGRFIKL